MPRSAASEHPYASFLTRVSRPARYVGGEHGEIRKDWEAARCRLCLAFPDAYEVGMSHLGLRILYDGVNAEDGLLAERCYAPWHDMEAELRARGEPLRSLESWRALSEFDMVGFSLQFELTYTNVLAMLDLGGIPLRSSERGEEDPLVIAGGPVATHAEPMAPFVDAFVVGDGEEITPRLMRLWADLSGRAVPRAERLAALAALRGIYVPSLYGTRRDAATGLEVVDRPLVPLAPLPIGRAVVDRLDDHPFPAAGPVACTETIFDRASIEIARGCTEGCRFCQAGMIYRPVRERSPVEILGSIRRGIDQSGYDEVSLASLSTADYSAIAPLVTRLMEGLDRDKVSLTVSSLRAYGLGEEVLSALERTRATGLTFAPEAGAQRMRDVVNKNVTDEQIRQSAERVFARGWSKLKLYFMIGLPTEQDEDVEAIVRTALETLSAGRRMQGRGTPRITVSVSTFVPKPHTPFQWCAMDDPVTIERKQRLLRDAAAGSRLALKLHDSSGSWLEGVLARGDRRLAAVIEEAYRRGARFDSWQDQLRLDFWRAAFTSAGVDPAPFLGALPLDARLPWDHVDVGLAPGFLAKEHAKALRHRPSPPCGKAVGMHIHHANGVEAAADRRKLVCYDCGIACDLEEMRGHRIALLDSLGATAPSPAADPEAERPNTPRRDRRVHLRRDQGPTLRLRLRYRRVGRAIYSSHLDFVRLLPRILRRAGLPMFYSEGFHPKPAMTFGPSLPLGVASLCEHVDLKLCLESLDPTDALRRLDTATVEGVEFLECRALEVSDRPLGKVVDEVVYVAGIDRGALESTEATDAASLAALLESRGSGELWITRRVKGRDRKVEVTAHVARLVVGEGADVLREVGIRGDLLPVTIGLHMSSTASPRACEALAALLGVPRIEARIARSQMVGHTADGPAAPLELERHRLPTPAIEDMEPDRASP